MSLILNIKHEGTDWVAMKLQLGLWRQEATVQQNGQAWRSGLCLCLKDKEYTVARAEFLRDLRDLCVVYLIPVLAACTSFLLSFCS